MLLKSKIMKNKIIYILLSLIIISKNLFGVSRHVEQQFPQITTPQTAISLPKHKPRTGDETDTIKESLDLFKVSCDGIKYTGALEQVAIDGLTQTKEAITKMLMPYFSLTTFEVALFTASFLECVVTVSSKETKGDVVHESATTTAISSIDKSRTGVSKTYGVAIGSSTGGTVNDTNFFPDVAGTFNAFLKSKVNDGWFDDIMACTQEKRLRNYQKIYEFFNQQFTLKLNYETMSFSQCNVELIKEGEEVPSWNAMFGNKINEYSNKFLDNLNKNPSYDTEISANQLCTLSDQTRCPKDQYKASELKYQGASSQKTLGTDYNPHGVSINPETGQALTRQEQMENAYPSSQGYTVTENADHTFTVQQTTYKIGAGTRARHNSMIQSQLEEWDAEQEKLNNESQEASSGNVAGNQESVKPIKNKYNQCINGISSIGQNDCLTAEQAADMRHLFVRVAPKTLADFTKILSLTAIEKIIFQIMYKNPRGYADILEYIYNKLRIINYKYAIAVKNTNRGKEDLNYIDTFTLSYKDNFKLNLSKNSYLVDIRKILIQNQNGDKVLPGSSFSRALLKRIVMEVTGHKIPIDKKLSNTDFEKVLKIYQNHKLYYERFIDIKYILAKNLKRIDGTNLVININSEDYNQFINGIAEYFTEQRKAIKAMFIDTNIIKDNDGNDKTEVTTSNSEVGLSSFVVGMNKKDFRQELIKRVNEDIIEYKLAGKVEKLKNIRYFYKMFLFLNPTSINKKMEIAEKILNTTTMATDKAKTNNLMHGIILEGILLERAENYRIIEKYINKRK